MLINIKIHSAFSSYFQENEYRVDAHNPDALNDYLKAVHPKFGNYIKQIENGEAEESYSLVDSNFRVIENDAFGLKRFRDGETVYIAPLVAGGGGKRGTFLLLMAFAVFAGPAIAGALSGGAAAGTGSLAAAQASTSAIGGASASGGVLGGLGKAFAAMPSFMKSIVGNLAMSVVSSIFNKKPKASQQTESTTRENGMFGSLTNTSTSGSPVPLHYGQVRVAGQFLSGYINSETHGKSDVIKVGDQFT